LLLLFFQPLIFASVKDSPTVAAANNGPTNPIGVAVAYNNHIVMVVAYSPEQSDMNNQKLGYQQK
jgi:hypothetical protein